MDLLLSDRALDHVRASGRELWVWLDERRCCSGSVSYLGASCEEPRGTARRIERRFRPVHIDDITVHMSLGARRPPDEIHIEVRGRLRPRIEAYWNGCIFVDDRGPARSRSATTRHTYPVA